MKNKRNRVINSEDGLAVFHRNPDELLGPYVIFDEIWIYYYTPEIKKPSEHWVFKGDLAPKKVKTVKSTDKFITTVLWNTRGIFYIDYLERGQSINEE